MDSLSKHIGSARNNISLKVIGQARHQIFYLFSVKHINSVRNNNISVIESAKIYFLGDKTLQRYMPTKS